MSALELGPTSFEIAFLTVHLCTVRGRTVFHVPISFIKYQIICQTPFLSSQPEKNTWHSARCGNHFALLLHTEPGPDTLLETRELCGEEFDFGLLFPCTTPLSRPLLPSATLASLPKRTAQHGDDAAPNGPTAGAPSSSPNSFHPGTCKRSRKGKRKTILFLLQNRPTHA